MREKILQYCLKMVYINVKSMDEDEIGRHVDTTSKQVSGINILQKHSLSY